MTAAVETEPVDDGAIADQAKHAWAGISRLRPGRDGADFGEAAAQAEDRVRNASVLVEAGGNPDRIWERQAPQVDSEPGIVWRPARIQPELERAQRRLVRQLGRKGEQQRLGEARKAGKHQVASSRV